MKVVALPTVTKLVKTGPAHDDNNAGPYHHPTDVAMTSDNSGAPAAAENEQTTAASDLELPDSQAPAGLRLRRYPRRKRKLPAYLGWYHNPYITKYGRFGVLDYWLYILGSAATDPSGMPWLRPMGFAVRVRSAGQKYGPTCHQRDRADVTEFVTFVRLSSLGQHVGVLALAGYKRRKSALTAGPIPKGLNVKVDEEAYVVQGEWMVLITVDALQEFQGCVLLPDAVLRNTETGDLDIPPPPVFGILAWPDQPCWHIHPCVYSVNGRRVRI